MDENIKEEAIEKLEEARGFIVLCYDGKQAYFGGEGLSLDETIMLVDLYKYRMIADHDKGE